MSTRNIKDAKNLDTGELIYFKGHAKATFMSDGYTVEDAVNKIISNTFTVVLHDSLDTIVTLTSDAIHKWDTIDSLQLTIPEDSELEERQYKVVFTPNEDFSLTMPSSIRWEGGSVPTFEVGYQYELNIQGDRCLYAQFNLS